MELTGKVIAVLQERSGTSKSSGSAWKVQEYVLETINEQYPKKMMFNIFGEDRIAQANLKEGDTVTIHFDINAREYNGRWYNDIRAFRVDHVEGAAASPAVEQIPVSTPFVPNDEKDDMPF